MNNVEIEGVLYNAPQLITTNNVNLCKLFIKHVKTYTNKFKTGEKISFVPIITWGPLATECKKLKKDDKIKVTGSLEYQMWEDNGEKKGRLVVIAKSVELIGEK